MDEMYKFLTSVFKVVLTPAARLWLSVCVCACVCVAAEGLKFPTVVVLTPEIQRPRWSGPEAVIGAMNSMGVSVESAEATPPAGAKPEPSLRTCNMVLALSISARLDRKTRVKHSVPCLMAHSSGSLQALHDNVHELSNSEHHYKARCCCFQAFDTNQNGRICFLER